MWNLRKGFVALLVVLVVVLAATTASLAIIQHTQTVGATVIVEEGIAVYLDAEGTQPANSLDFGTAYRGENAAEHPTIYIKNLTYDELSISITDDLPDEYGSVGRSYSAILGSKATSNGVSFSLYIDEDAPFGSINFNITISGTPTQ